MRKRANDDPLNTELEEWMAVIRRLGKDGAPDARRLGKFLSKNKARLVRGMQLVSEQDGHDKILKYHVEVKPAGYAGNAGFDGHSFQSREFKKRDRESRNYKDSESSEYETDPAKPANPAEEFEGNDGPWEAEI